MIYNKITTYLEFVCLSIYVQDVQSNLSPAEARRVYPHALTVTTQRPRRQQLATWTNPGRRGRERGGEERRGKEVCIISPSPPAHECACVRVRGSVCARVWLINKSPFAMPRVGLFSPVDKPRGKRIWSWIRPVSAPVSHIFGCKEWERERKKERHDLTDAHRKKEKERKRERVWTLDVLQ